MFPETGFLSPFQNSLIYFYTFLLISWIIMIVSLTGLITNPSSLTPTSFQRNFKKINTIMPFSCVKDFKVFPKT